MSDIDETNTTYYKFKCTLQNFLRSEGIVGISIIIFGVVGILSILMAISVSIMYVHVDDKFDRNLFTIGKSDYQESYIIYNAEKSRETTIMSEDGESEIDLMYMVFHSDETSLNSDFTWTTKVSKVALYIVLVLFSFQILAFVFNSYVDNDDKCKHRINSENANWYCIPSFVLISISMLLLMYVFNFGIKFKSQVDEVYTIAIQAMNIPLAKDEIYINKLTTRQKFQLVNKYLKKMVYKKTPLMFDIKNKVYVPFDLNKIKNFSEVEKLFEDKNK